MSTVDDMRYKAVIFQTDSSNKKARIDLILHMLHKIIWFLCCLVYSAIYQPLLRSLHFSSPISPGVSQLRKGLERLQRESIYKKDYNFSVYWTVGIVI